VKGRSVKCPGCGREIEWSTTNRWRPFCSERCKLIDLGAWIAEDHAIPGEPVLEAPEVAAPAPSRRHHH
jgi:endogenous inhibitor of DNA gyrase (YacG/DUF329 family)